MSSPPTLGERVRNAFSKAIKRPGPVLTALAIGLVAGLLVRGATSAESKPRDARQHPAPVAGKQPRPLPPASGPNPKPAATAAPEAGDIATRMGQALAAVEKYAETEPAIQIGAAIAPLDGSAAGASAGTVGGGRPWSTMKVPAAAAYLNFKRQLANAASGEETIPPGTTPREDLGNALVNSDNIAIRHRIQDMIHSLGPTGAAAAINRALEAGGAQPQIQPAIDPSIDSLQIGTGEWTLTEAANWFRRLQAGAECIGLAAADRKFLLKQLRAAPSALHWGAATVLNNSDIALKPGWGSEGSQYTVEQAVIVGNGEEEDGDGFPSLQGGYVMVLMTVLPSSNPSAFTEGQGQLATLAEIIDEKMGTPGPETEGGPGAC